MNNFLRLFIYLIKLNFCFKILKRGYKIIMENIDDDQYSQLPEYYTPIEIKCYFCETKNFTTSEELYEYLCVYCDRIICDKCQDIQNIGMETCYDCKSSCCFTTSLCSVYDNYCNDSEYDAHDNCY